MRALMTAVVYFSTFLTLGYYLGENWKPIAELIHSYIHYASAVLIAVAIIGYFWKKHAKTRR